MVVFSQRVWYLWLIVCQAGADTTKPPMHRQPAPDNSERSALSDSVTVVQSTLVEFIAPTYEEKADISTRMDVSYVAFTEAIAGTREIANLLRHMASDKLPQNMPAASELTSMFSKRQYQGWVSKFIVAATRFSHDNFAFQYNFCPRDSSMNKALHRL